MDGNRHQQILDRVKQGRWEMAGGIWVEPDLNMPDGESLVRQLLIGKRFFKNNFGTDVHIGWNPTLSATTGNYRKSISGLASITLLLKKWRGMIPINCR